MIKGIRPRLAEAGKIKTGGLGATKTSKDGREYRLPVSYDHFVITRNDRDSAGDLVLDRVLMDAILKLQRGAEDSTAQPEKIREIPIVLHSDELEEVFPTSYACYLGKKLHCRGDGEKATRWEIKDARKTGVITGMKCTCPYLGATGGPICKPHGILHCSIAVQGHALAGAVHKWRTTSLISIERLLASLEQIRSLIGSLRGIPLWLKLEPVEVTPKDAPAKTVYCCHVEVRAQDMVALQQKALEMAQMRKQVATTSAQGYRQLIETSVVGDVEEDAGAVQEEFHPELEHRDGVVFDRTTGEVLDTSPPLDQREDHEPMAKRDRAELEKLWRDRAPTLDWGQLRGRVFGKNVELGFPALTLGHVRQVKAWLNAGQEKPEDGKYYRPNSPGDVGHT